MAWLIPLALAGLLIQQVSVFYGITNTMEQGELLEANITDFRIKQIAAQTNGYVDLQFLDSTGAERKERLSLHAQHASRLIGANTVEIRYLAGTAYDIVIVKTFEYHRSTVLVNLGVILLSLLVMIPVSIWASRYARRRAAETEAPGGGELRLEFENQPAGKA
ncbi:MAG: hypothetical protein LAT75_06885 [Candidatus Cyclonatronum sp.]|uniref:hypothetical protein n=1 Tax=Cyclonatronum sp. TaxID=3024185 RepID=UPI0025B931C7|nr:hypothetical protein [Cyclonatronum sp.]MCC5933356.1 hypothetical protein [Balneolales bacterium]MCH8486573.1 hypothetical protein [Cyclonatronum sp.]